MYVQPDYCSLKLDYATLRHLRPDGMRIIRYVTRMQQMMMTRIAADLRRSAMNSEIEAGRGKIEAHCAQTSLGCLVTTRSYTRKHFPKRLSRP